MELRRHLHVTYQTVITGLRRFDPTNLGYLGVLAVPGWLFPSLRPLALFGIFFLFWLWPSVSMLWSASADGEQPTAWINVGGRQYYTRYFVTQIPTMFNPFVLFTSIGQIVGQLHILARYRGSLPGPEERSQTITYRLPFDGEWTILNGSIREEQSHSWSLYTQRYAYDFVKTDEDGKTHTGDGTSNDDYYCFDEPIYAPADGVVISARNTHRDCPSPGGSLDIFQRDIRGNYVTIDHGGEYSVLAHLAEGSVDVKAGDRVERGELIGRCGNSGNSTEPHLHFHVQDAPSFFLGMGIPIVFEQLQTVNPIDGSTELVENGFVRAGLRVRNR